MVRFLINTVTERVNPMASTVYSIPQDYLSITDINYVTDSNLYTSVTNSSLRFSNDDSLNITSGTNLYTIGLDTGTSDSNTAVWRIETGGTTGNIHFNNHLGVKVRNVSELEWNITVPVFNYTTDNSFIVWPTQSPAEQKREEIRSRLRASYRSRGVIVHIEAQPANEMRALETLREMISETDFRRYLRYGFIMVKGASGDRYQVFRDQWHTKIWRDGKVVEEVCVRLGGKVPPTDNVIAFKVMIEADENCFLSSGNRYRNLHQNIAVAA